MINPTKQLHSDRFIPVRCQSAPKNTLNNKLANDQTQTKEPSLATVRSKKNKLTFSKSLSTQSETVLDFLSSLPHSCKTSKSSLPITINYTNMIDVPGVVNNFYYNTIDVSQQDFVAVGLKNQLYMFRQSDRQLISFNNRKSASLISCVKFSLSDQILMCSDEEGFIEIHDIEKVRTLRKFRQHISRVGRIQTDPINSSIFYSGSKDYMINVNDLRQKKAAVSSLNSHKSEICGLSIKDKYLASSSNDGNVKIWDIRSQKLLQTLSYHNAAAVKALSWCPWKSNILVSGGGKKDQKIVIYDFNEKKIQNTIPVNCQISDICWRNSTQQMIFSYFNKDYKGIIKSHNYFNPTSVKKKMSIHTGRIIGFRVSKKRDNMIYSLSADQSLIYWDLDNIPKKVNVPEVMNNNFQFE